MKYILELGDNLKRQLEYYLVRIKEANLWCFYLCNVSYVVLYYAVKLSNSLIANESMQLLCFLHCNWRPICVLQLGSSSWEAADLGNEERKQKFLRLMGAGKVRFLFCIQPIHCLYKIKFYSEELPKRYYFPWLYSIYFVFEMSQQGILLVKYSSYKM